MKPINIVIVALSIMAIAIIGIGLMASKPTLPTQLNATGATICFDGVIADPPSYIENITIVATGSGSSATRIGPGNGTIIGQITTTGGTVNVAAGQAFDIWVLVRCGADNCGYVNKDNMNLEFSSAGAFVRALENAATGNKYMIENTNLANAAIKNNGVDNFFVQVKVATNIIENSGQTSTITLTPWFWG